MAGDSITVIQSAHSSGHYCYESSYDHHMDHIKKPSNFLTDLHVRLNIILSEK